MKGVEPKAKKAKPDNGAPVGQPFLVPPPPVAVPVDLPHFKIWSLYIGQGDCFIIQCPDNQFIMIDCGSIRTALNEDQATKIVNKFNEIFAAFPKVIKALILTHSDEDHHNRVFLLNRAGLVVEKVIIGNYEWTDLYFRGKGSKETMKATTAQRNKLTTDVENILTSSVNTWKYLCEKFKRTNPDTLTILKNGGCKHFVGLTFNTVPAMFGNNVRLNSREVNIQFDNLLPDDPVFIPKPPETLWGTSPQYKGFYQVHAQGNWSVKIIAAQVESDDNEKSAYMNAASMVTVIKIGDKKALFTGDSTGATFKYLLRQDLPNDIKNLFGDLLPIPPVVPGTIAPSRFELLQVPHHGSNSHESHLQDFINKAKANCVVTSVRFNELKFRLPKWEALTRWKSNDRIYKEVMKDHYIGYWINAQELKDKSILDAVNPFLGPPNKPSDQQLNKLFPFPLNKPNRPKNREIVYFKNLKYNAQPQPGGLPRNQNLYLVGGNSYKYVFVVQYTGKAIASNGANAVKNFLDEQIKANDGKIEFDIKTKDLVDFAFDNISVTKYKLNAEKISWPF